MTSVPFAGPCSVCGQHTHRKCGKCSVMLYCCKDCQIQDWPQHKLTCHRSHRGVCRPTSGDFERAVRKVKAKLAKFEAQVALWNLGAGESPQIEICTHPDLQRVMSTDWLNNMNNWVGQASVELIQGISFWSIRFCITRIGGVMAEHVLNNKNTGIVLYQKDKNQHREWTVVVEPLDGYNGIGLSTSWQTMLHNG